MTLGYSIRVSGDGNWYKISHYIITRLPCACLAVRGTCGIIWKWAFNIKQMMLKQWSHTDVIRF